LAVKSLPKRIESLAPLFCFHRRVGASLCSAMAPEEVLAPQQNFHLMRSGNTQPKKRVFPKAHRDITTTRPYQHPPTTIGMYEYEPSSNESPSRAVAPVPQQPQNTKDNVGRPLSSPPGLEQREASAARRRGILVTKSEEPQSPAPPIGEIRIPVHPNYMSITSPCSASLPNSTNQSTTDYESLYFSTVRANHCLKQHLVYVSEENRTLKRHLIELQRRLFTARRNSNRGQQQQQQRRRPEDGPSTMTTNTSLSVNEDDSDNVRGWSVPQSFHKRIKRDDSFTLSPKVSVPQSVSSEETVV
jgi:hypothetical protein